MFDGAYWGREFFSAAYWPGPAAPVVAPVVRQPTQVTVTNPRMQVTVT